MTRLQKFSGELFALKDKANAQQLRICYKVKGSTECEMEMVVKTVKDEVSKIAEQNGYEVVWIATEHRK